MVAFRRRMRGRLGARRRHRRGSVRFARTRVVNGVFEVEGLEYAIGQPGSTSFGAWQTTVNGFLAAYQIVSSQTQAVLYAIRFNPSILFSLCPDFSSLASLYDYTKIRKVVMRLRTQFNPLTQLTQALPSAAGTLISESGAPGMDHDVSYIDYDGIQLVQGIPANGDNTSLSLNRLRARKHKAFSNITRVFIPKSIIPLAVTQPSGGTGNLPVMASFVGKQGGPSPWMATGANNNVFTGQVGLAFSYKGSDTTAINKQPLYSYTVACEWFISVKSLLLG